MLHIMKAGDWRGWEFVLLSLVILGFVLVLGRFCLRVSFVGFWGSLGFLGVGFFGLLIFFS